MTQETEPEKEELELAGESQIEPNEDFKAENEEKESGNYSKRKLTFS